MKAHLLQAEQWLHACAASEARDICLALLWEIDKIELGDVPQLGSIPEYEAYCTALDFGLDSDDEAERLFFQRSSFHFTRLEQLLGRFGVASIQQVLIKLFIDTLAKGFAIVAFCVVVLVACLLWFSELTRAWYVLAATFASTATILVLLEVWLDLKRDYEDDLEFVEKASEA